MPGCFKTHINLAPAFQQSLILCVYVCIYTLYSRFAHNATLTYYILCFIFGMYKNLLSLTRQLYYVCVQTCCVQQAQCKKYVIAMFCSSITYLLWIRGLLFVEIEISLWQTNYFYKLKKIYYFHIQFIQLQTFWQSLKLKLCSSFFNRRWICIRSCLDTIWRKYVINNMCKNWTNLGIIFYSQKFSHVIMGFLGICRTAQLKKNGEFWRHC